MHSTKMHLVLWQACYANGGRLRNIGMIATLFVTHSRMASMRAAHIAAAAGGTPLAARRAFSCEIAASIATAPLTCLNVLKL